MITLLHLTSQQISLVGKIWIMSDATMNMLQTFKVQ